MKMPFGQKVIERITTQGITLVGLVAVNVVVARQLGPDGKGALALAILIPNVLYVLTNFGYVLSNYYFLGRKKESTHKLITNALVFGMATSVVASLVFLILFPLIQEWFFSGISPVVIFVSLVAMPFLQITNILNSFLLIRDRTRIFNGIGIFKILLHVVLVIILLVFLQYGVMAALIAWIVSQSVAVGITFYEVAHIEKWKLSFDPRLLLKTIRFGVKGCIGNFTIFLSKRVNLILVSFFLAISDVGIYSVALALSEAFYQLPSAVNVLLFPRVSASTNTNSNDFTPRIFRNMFYILLLGAVFAALIADPVVSILFGEQFLDAIQVFYIGLPGMVAIGSFSLLGYDLAGRGKLGTQSFFTGLTLALHVIFGSVLIPMYNLNGAAASSTIAYFIVFVVAIIVFIKITGVRLRDLFILRKSDIAYYGKLISRLRVRQSE